MPTNNLLNYLSPDQRRKQSANRLADQWEPEYVAPTPQLPPEGREPWVSDGDILQRSELFPAGIYQQPDGSKKIGMAWPGILSGEMSSPGDHSPEAGEAYARTAVSNAVFPSAVGRAVGTVPVNALGSAGSGAPKGIRAYHGSPHDFDKFDLSKIGTGEGAQAYGHGLYFAEREGVAKDYRDKLAGKPYIEDAAAADTYKNSMLDWFKTKQGAPPSTPEMKQPGRMYEVNLNADPEHFLDWDKPLSQQSEKVRTAITPDVAEFASWADKSKALSPDIIDRMKSGAASGSDYGYLVAQDGESTRRLRDAGIPGIKYLDQGSRSAGEGSRNYVVFDDKIISILKKYGLAGTAVAGGGMAFQPQDASAAPLNNLLAAYGRQQN